LRPGPLLSTFSKPATTIAIVATFSALSLGTNYALIGIPNVKLMDALVFLSAFIFGLRVGIAVATSTWAVYGFVNPNGTADLILLSFLVVGESFYAIAGAGLRRTNLGQDLLVDKSPYARFSIVFGTLGLLATFAYDVLTNFASWLFKTNSLYDSLVIGLITGAPFALLHEVSNLVFFATTAPAAIIATRRICQVPSRSGGQ